MSASPNAPVADLSAADRPNRPRRPKHAAAPNRPHCERPQACDAKGAGHCRSCHFRSVTKALHADPEFKAATAARMKALHADPEFKARMKALHADPEFKAAAAARMKALRADPEFKARMKALHAKKIAALGLLDAEVADWRTIKAKGFSSADAARIIIKSRKTAT